VKGKTQKGLFYFVHIVIKKNFNTTFLLNKSTKIFNPLPPFFIILNSQYTQKIFSHSQVTILTDDETQK